MRPAGPVPALAATVLLLLAAAPARAQSRAPADVPTIVARASAYAAKYVSALASVVSEERYEQDVSFAMSLPQASETNRVLLSDYLLVRLPGMRGLVPFRDVFSVDGRAVRDREDRLTRLFIEPTAAGLEQAERIRSESSRYNIGNAVRDINVPTFALQFLLPEVRGRFTFRIGGSEIVDGVAAAVVDYEETTYPTLITGKDGESVPARGSIWVDPADGSVLRTRIDTRSGPKRARIDVQFRREPRLGMLVPVEMRERHDVLEEKITGIATYGNYRQFKVETTEQVR